MEWKSTPEFLISWPAVHRVAWRTARQRLAARRNGAEEANDVAQETVARLLVQLAKGARIRNPEGWACQVSANLAMDVLRGRRTASGPASEWTIRLPAVDATGPEQPPDELAQLREEARRATDTVARLPAPYAQIIALQYLHSWTRAEVIRWLRTWRPVSKEHCRRLLRRGHAILLTIGEERNPWRRHEAWFGKKNRWMTTPPPPLRH